MNVTSPAYLPRGSLLPLPQPTTIHRKVQVKDIKLHLHPASLTSNPMDDKPVVSKPETFTAVLLWINGLLSCVDTAGRQRIYFMNLSGVEEPAPFDMMCQHRAIGVIASNDEDARIMFALLRFHYEFKNAKHDDIRCMPYLSLVNNVLSCIAADLEDPVDLCPPRKTMQLTRLSFVETLFEREQSPIEDVAVHTKDLTYIYGGRRYSRHVKEVTLWNCHSLREIYSPPPPPSS